MNKLDPEKMKFSKTEMKDMRKYKFIINQNYFFIYNKKSIFYYELKTKGFDPTKLNRIEL